LHCRRWYEYKLSTICSASSTHAFFQAYKHHGYVSYPDGRLQSNSSNDIGKRDQIETRILNVSAWHGMLQLDRSAFSGFIATSFFFPPPPQTAAQIGAAYSSILFVGLTGRQKRKNLKWNVDCSHQTAQLFWCHRISDRTSGDPKLLLLIPPFPLNRWREKSDYYWLPEIDLNRQRSRQTDTHADTLFPTRFAEYLDFHNCSENVPLIKIIVVSQIRWLRWRLWFLHRLPTVLTP
jgi:hypothetical protein